MASKPVLLPTNVVPEHYELTITPNLETALFDGEMSMEVVCGEEGTDTVELHSKELNIVSAEYMPEGGKSIALVGISYNLKMTTVALKFESELPAGKASVKVQYKGILNSDMAGFSISNYTDAEGNNQKMGSTQFEALDARRAFPCVDEPAAKATFGLTLVVPQGLTALSNMPETRVCHQKGGKKAVTFERSPKMSTYLLCWAVGELDCIRGMTDHGVSISIYAPPGRADQGRFALDFGKKCLDFYDDFFGVPYPLPKLDMICITEFAMGAMENWGLVTYREVDLMIDPENASTQQLKRVADVVAHELAHQWFGNLVTMKWWDDLWLNEGFAAFMENYCADACLPATEGYDVWEQYTVQSFQYALRLDALRTSHPIQVPIAHAEEVEQVFDAISYCKGSSVVRMVKCILGDDKFRLGLQKYMATYAYGNTVTMDLWNAWTEASGIDVANIMGTWTNQMGYPVLFIDSCSMTPTSVKVTLTQQYFLASGDALTDEEKAKRWTIPLLFATKGLKSQTAVLMDQQTQTFEVPTDASAQNYFLKINAGQEALVRVVYSSELMDGLLKAVANGDLSAVDRASLLSDAFTAARANVPGASLETVVRIIKALDASGETSHTVWTILQPVCDLLAKLMKEVGGEAETSFTTFVGNMVKKALKTIGWEKRAGEKKTDSLLRAILIGGLDKYCSKEPEVVAEARRRFDGHWEDSSLLPSDLKTPVYRLCVKTGGKAEYERLLQAFYDTSDNAIKKDILLSLGATADSALKTRTLDWAVKSGEVKMQDFFYAVGACTGGDGAQLTWTYFQDNFTFIREKLKRAIPSLLAAIISYSINFCTLEKAAEVEQFFTENPVPTCERKINQQLEDMRSNGKLLVMLKSTSLVNAAAWN